MSRGGKGGRGGLTKSLTKDQLNAIGASGGDVPTPVTQPPPLYPPLDKRPGPLTQSFEMDYMLILRQDFIDHMQLSGAYVTIREHQQNNNEKEINKLVAQITSSKEKFDWTLFPAELRPKILAKRISKKLSKEIDVNKKLTLLEKLEQKDVEEGSKKDEEEEEVEEIEMIDEDEEMDDGTDYANNYFDNGEAYEDEDDALEDGPIF